MDINEDDVRVSAAGQPGGIPSANSDTDTVLIGELLVGTSSPQDAYHAVDDREVMSNASTEDFARRPVASEATTRLPQRPFTPPRNDWPPEAQALRSWLAERFGAADTLCDWGAGFITNQRKPAARRAYASHLRCWCDYAASRGVHPLTATRALADNFNEYLRTEPSSRVRNPRDCRAGEPRKPRTRAAILSACLAFYEYTDLRDNPFRKVKRPKIKKGSSPTTALSATQRDQLVDAAYQHHRRSYALVLLLLALGLRINEALGADITDIRTHAEHRVLQVWVKGLDEPILKPLAPAVWRALSDYIGDRTLGPIFVTRNNRRWTESEVWSHLQVLAGRAGFGKDVRVYPHTFRAQYIYDQTRAGRAIEDVQNDVGHANISTTMGYAQRQVSLDSHGTFGFVASLKLPDA